jgi:hypothetical protein
VSSPSSDAFTGRRNSPGDMAERRTNVRFGSWSCQNARVIRVGLATSAPGPLHPDEQSSVEAFGRPRMSVMSMLNLFSEIANARRKTSMISMREKL